MPRGKAKKPKQSPPKAKDTRTTKEKMKEMLAHYAETCNVVRAAERAGIPRRLHYQWIDRWPRYAEVFEKTKRAAAEYMESVAVERASEGWLEPIYYQGSQCGEVRRYDSGLMQLLLRGLMPDKYGMQRAEISGPQGEPVQAKIEVVFVKP
jgi:hypothetical protein